MKLTTAKPLNLTLAGVLAVVGIAVGYLGYGLFQTSSAFVDVGPNYPGGDFSVSLRVGAQNRAINDNDPVEPYDPSGSLLSINISKTSVETLDWNTAIYEAGIRDSLTDKWTWYNIGTKTKDEITNLDPNYLYYTFRWKPGYDAGGNFSLPMPASQVAIGITLGKDLNPDGGGTVVGHAWSTRFALADLSFTTPNETTSWAIGDSATMAVKFAQAPKTDLTVTVGLKVNGDTMINSPFGDDRVATLDIAGGGSSTYFPITWERVGYAIDGTPFNKLPSSQAQLEASFTFSNYSEYGVVSRAFNITGEFPQYANLRLESPDTTLIGGERSTGIAVGDSMQTSIFVDTAGYQNITRIVAEVDYDPQLLEVSSLVLDAQQPVISHTESIDDTNGKILLRLNYPGVNSSAITGIPMYMITWTGLAATDDQGTLIELNADQAVLTTSLSSNAFDEVDGPWRVIISEPPVGITIHEPADGTDIYIGGDYTIRFSTLNIPSDAVNIYLQNQTSYLGVIDDLKIDSDGVHEYVWKSRQWFTACGFWNDPINLIIEDATDPTVFDSLSDIKLKPWFQFKTPPDECDDSSQTATYVAGDTVEVTLAFDSKYDFPMPENLSNIVMRYHSYDPEAGEGGVYVYSDWVEISSSINDFNINGDAITYNWTVPSLAYTPAIVEIEFATADDKNPVESPYTRHVADTAAFEITNPDLESSIEVIQPISSTVWVEGGQGTIEYTSSNVDFVDIFYSDVGGGNYTLIDANVAATGTYIWAPESMHVSETARIRVMNSADETVSDESEVFRIVAAGEYQPAGGVYISRLLTLADSDHVVTTFDGFDQVSHMVAGVSSVSVTAAFFNASGQSLGDETPYWPEGNAKFFAISDSQPISRFDNESWINDVKSMQLRIELYTSDYTDTASQPWVESLGVAYSTVADIVEPGDAPQVLINFTAPVQKTATFNPALDFYMDIYEGASAVTTDLGPVNTDANDESLESITIEAEVLSFDHSYQAYLKTDRHLAAKAAQDFSFSESDVVDGEVAIDLTFPRLNFGDIYGQTTSTDLNARDDIVDALDWTRFINELVGNWSSTISDFDQNGIIDVLDAMPFIGTDRHYGEEGDLFPLWYPDS